ncbi:MAG: tetratricopeptide repeat protein [Gemmatimonadota bacterium]
MKAVPILTMTFAAILSTASLGKAQDPHEHTGPDPSQIGTVHFATSCDAAAQPDFDRGVALLHSFWFGAAIDGFQGVLSKDPGCAMAWWGIAMSEWGNPFGGIRSTAALERGAAAVQKAVALAPPTDRERAYVAAAGELYRDFPSTGQRSRIVAYERAMEGVYRAHPDDSEAAVFYALAIDQAAASEVPPDKTYAGRLAAGALLEDLFADQPGHPGIAHYIIHSYDVPALAPRALDAARSYARIAPAAPHALHMPSHTFTLAGLWQESIDTNTASSKVAREEGSVAEELHAMDYQMYAYLQTCRDGSASRLAEGLPDAAARLDVSAAGGGAPGPAGLFALAAMPARYALERGKWQAAAALSMRPTAFPPADAVTRFARALGAARSGDTAAATAEIAELERLREVLEGRDDDYWAGQVEIQRRVASAWLAQAEGREEVAVELLRSAADMEDGTEKSAITPGPLAPARELLGEMLIEQGRPEDALLEFETSLEKGPDRFRSLHGAARAAELGGDLTKARLYYDESRRLCQGGDGPERDEVESARAFLGR